MSDGKGMTPAGRHTNRRAVSLIWLLAQALALAFTVTVVASVIGLTRKNGRSPRVRWAASSGTTAPSDFRILMFPATPEVVYEAGDPPAQRPLDRAMANTLGELAQDRIAMVLSADRRGAVRRDDLRFDAPPERRRALLAAWQTAWLARTPDSSPDETWAVVQAVSEGRTDVRLQISTRDETRQWRYSTDGKAVFPIEYRYANRMDDAVADLSSLVNWAAGGATAGVGLGAGWIIARGRRSLAKT